MGLIAKWRRDKNRRRDDKYLGGDPRVEQRLYETAEQDKLVSTAREESAYRKLNEQTDATKGLAEGAADEYRGSKGDTRKAIGESRDAAYGIGEATQGAKSALTTTTRMANRERQNALAKDNMRSSAESAILANRQQALQQAQAQAGMNNRAAMGLASGQGEGGALAMQQAMQSAAQANADVLTNSQLQQNQMANDMRYQAAAADREAQLAFAQQNAADMTAMGQNVAQTGMTGAQAQQQALANQAGLVQNQQQMAAQRQANFLGQANQMQAAQENAAAQNLGQNMDYQSGLLTAKFGAQSNRNQSRPAWKQALFPMGILGGN